MKHAIFRFEVSHGPYERKALTETLSLALATTALLPALASAGPAEGTSEASEVFKLGTYVVNGQPLEATDAVEYRIPTQTLELLEKRELSQALSVVPGVTLTRFGGRNETAVYVRGFGRNQTPVFMDGVPVYVPYDGFIDLGRFTTFDIAAIDVAKGYSSPLFGANTMGGAINLVSRRPVKPFEGRLAAGLFAGDGREVSLNVGGRRKSLYAQFGYSFLERDTYPLSSDFVPVAAENGGDRDNAHQKDWKLSGKVGYTPNATDEYALGFSRQEGEKGNPPQTTAPKYWRWPMWDKQTLYFVSTTRLGEIGYLKPRAFYDTYQNSLGIYDDATYTTQNKTSSSTSRYDDYTYGTSLEVGTDWLPKNSLKGVFHYKFDHHKEHPDLARKPSTAYVLEDALVSLGFEDTFKLSSRWQIQGGASYDDRESRAAVDTSTGNPYPLKDFKEFNPQAGLFHSLTENHSLRFTAARKSRFPTMRERFSYRLGNGIPNPDLAGEVANHFEFGYLGQPAKTLRLEASIYFAKVNKTIQQVYLSPTSTITQFQNIGKTERKGLDFSLKYDAAPWLAVAAGGAFLQQDSLTTLPKNTEPVKPLDSPKRTAFAHLEIKPVAWLSLVPSAQFASWRYSYSDGRGTSRTLPGYTTFDLKASIKLPKGITISAGLENAFDKNYSLGEGYPEAGRSWFTNVRYAF